MLCLTAIKKYIIINMKIEMVLISGADTKSCKSRNEISSDFRKENKVRAVKTPKLGEIYLVHFDLKTWGYEMRGIRPAVVVTPTKLIKMYNLVEVHPITSTKRKFHSHIPLDDRTVTQGMICCEHSRFIDFSRLIKKIENVPTDVLEKIYTYHTGVLEYFDDEYESLIS